MKLIRYNKPYTNPFADFEDLFDTAFFGNRRAPYSKFYGTDNQRSLALNVYQDDDNYYVTAELPGFNKKDVKVELDNGTLSISADRKVKQGKSESTTQYKRTISVSDGVDASKIKASLDNGELTVTLPKAEESKPRSINVN